MTDKQLPPLSGKPLGDLLIRVRREVNVDPEASYQEIGIRSHCRGIFHKTPATGAQLGNKRVFWVEPGCLILNIIFAWEQAIAITGESEAGMIASHRFPMYRSRNGCLLPEYAWRYFSTPRGRYDLTIASPGGAGRNKTLGQDEFARLRIPIPPVENQRKIVSVIATIDRAIVLTEHLIAAKQRLKVGLAQLLLSGRLRLPGFSRPWKRTHLGDLATILFSSVDKKSRRGETIVRLCNYTDVYYNDFITADMQFMSATASQREVEFYSLRRGDVVITKDSESPDDIAKPAVVTEDLPGVVCGYHLAILQPTRANSYFLAHLLRMAQTRHELYRTANGITRFGLGMLSLRKLPLDVPEPEEQERIAAVLTVIDTQIALHGRKLSSLRVLKQGLMQKLFCEPAGVQS